jgi:ceramide glucosyltransferase
MESSDVTKVKGRRAGAFSFRFVGLRLPMSLMILYLFLLVATFPFIYYLIALYSSWKFFHARATSKESGYTPPVSNLQPIRGVDANAYENLASLCDQNYPDYELLFCVSTAEDPVVAMLEQLAREFPQRRIRVMVGSGREGSNDKVAKLARLVSEASHEVLVINDSDVRVGPDYLRSVVAPLNRPGVGAVTCFYTSLCDKTFAEHLHSIGMMSDFFAGLLVARQLDGVKFAIGKTIVTTRRHLEEFGGYESLENSPGDDLLVGRLIAEHGHTVELLNYTVQNVSDAASFRDLLHKRLRWIVVMRHMRPGGHFGLLFTHGLPWSIMATLIHPSLAVALGYFGTYLTLRMAMTWMIAVHGLKLSGVWARMPLIPIWDLAAFLLWVASFTRSSIRWRDGQYYIREGKLVPVAPATAQE